MKKPYSDPEIESDLKTLMDINGKFESALAEYIRRV